MVPEVLLNNGSVAIGLSNARSVGAIAAILVSVCTRNLLLTIVLGMGVFFGWQSILRL